MWLWPRPATPEAEDTVAPSYVETASRLMAGPEEEEAASSIARRIKCPIPGCTYAFKNAPMGWDGHVASLKKHPGWHPDIESEEARKKLFREEFPAFAVEDPETAAVVREYWERRADTRALAVVEECARLVEAAGLTVRWSFAKYYIALGGPRQHFAWFRPQRTGPRCSVHLRTEAERRSEQCARIRDAGLRLTSEEGHQPRFQVSGADVARNRGMLQEFFEAAFRRAEG